MINPSVGVAVGMKILSVKMGLTRVMTGGGGVTLITNGVSEGTTAVGGTAVGTLVGTLVGALVGALVGGTGVDVGVSVGGHGVNVGTALAWTCQTRTTLSVLTPAK